MDVDYQKLNEQHAIPGHLSFHPGPGELCMAVINNAHAAAIITLAGGHVMTYTPHGGKPLLWVSPKSAFEPGKGLRGGVPVCWPWFANQVEDPQNKPGHGLVRTMLWSVESARALPGGETELRLRVSDTPETRAVWPHAFGLELAVTVGPRLRLEWTARNPGSQPFTYTGAFHPYLVVSDVYQVMLRGLEGVDYLDKNDAFARKTQAGPLRFAGPVDNVYLNTTADLAIEDPGLGRTIRIAKSGSHTTVVWNPYHNDARIPDMEPGSHRQFFCAEAANAAEDVITVAPGGQASLVMELWTEPLP